MNRKLRRAQERDTLRYNALMLDRIGKAFERVAVRNHTSTYRELYTRFLDANRGSWEEFGLKAEVLRGEPAHKRWFAGRYRHNWPLRLRRFFYGLWQKMLRAGRNNPLPA